MFCMSSKYSKWYDIKCYAYGYGETNFVYEGNQVLDYIFFILYAFSKNIWS